LIGGTLDPVTPPRNAASVAATLTHSRTVMVERGAHDFEGMEGGDCVDHVIAEFIASGDEKKVDTSCVARIRPAPFILK
jgi:hypothetical protein